MIWVTGKNGMLGSALCRELGRTGPLYAGSGSEVDISSPDAVHRYGDRLSGLTWIINGAALVHFSTDYAFDGRSKALDQFLHAIAAERERV